tara:strand:+ start:641 stop:1318 length:678 start_codon:yes stop_codon:yes gene_type:complete
MKCNRSPSKNIHYILENFSLPLGERAEKLKTVTLNKHSRTIYSFFKYFKTRLLYKASPEEKIKTQYILDLKNQSSRAIDEFKECIIESIENTWMEPQKGVIKAGDICLLRVPSSQAQTKSGLDFLNKEICNEKGYINGSDIIIRHMSRPRKHLTPGPRTPCLDFDTLGISDHMIEATKHCKVFLILDDVVVSGYSLLVCSYYLSKSKYARKTHLLALGRNQSDYD